MTAVGDPDRPLFESNLAAALSSRFDHCCDSNDLDDAANNLVQAVRAVPVDHPNRPGYLSNLGTILQSRFVLIGDITDLDQALVMLCEAATITGTDDPARSLILLNYIQALLARYDQTAAVADLDTAIAAARDVVGSFLIDPVRAGILSALSDAYHSRYTRLAVPEDLDQAVAIGQEAVRATAQGDPHLAERLVGLGKALRTRFDHTGTVDDLDTAINVTRRATALADTSTHRNPAAYSSSLGAALLARFEYLGALDDLDQAVAAWRDAVASTRADGDSRAWMLSNLGAALLTRFRRNNAVADLNDAIDVGREARACIPIGDPDRGILLSNLANALGSRFGVAEDLADLDEAIDADREALAATMVGHPSRAGMLTDLGIRLLARFTHTRDVTDLVHAVQASRNAVAACPPGHHHRAGVLSNLGHALRSELTVAEDPHTRVEAMNLYRAGATQSPSSPPLVRARSARSWAELAAEAGDWAEASRAWDQLVDLLPSLVQRRLDRRDRQHHLALLTGAGPLAASTALNNGRTDHAMMLLEQGRGVLLGQALEARTDTAHLARNYPDLAKDIERFSRLLSDDPTHSATTAPEASVARMTADRVKAAAEWDRLLTAVRRIDGFHRFGLPPTLDQLREAAVEGVIVAVNVTQLRCDALLLTSEGVDLINLADATRLDAAKHAHAFLLAVQTGSARRTAAAIAETLEWLWDTVTGPVLHHLGYLSGAAVLPRVWWMPTGPLSFLPLHASGHHNDAPGPTRRTVLDRVISSYTPTVRALMHARARPLPRVHRPLILGVDDAPGHPSLTFATQEATDVSRILQPQAQALLDGKATHEAVTQLLPTATLAHFACHAVNEADPAESHLVLHDHPLTARELAGMDFARGYLAFLSACATAVPSGTFRLSGGGVSTGLIDESIHIASALLVAGFKHVVATLWPVSDAVAPQFSQHIYGHLRENPDPARAVHRAVHAIRDLYPRQPYLWASHVHIGA